MRDDKPDDTAASKRPRWFRVACVVAAVEVLVLVAISVTPKATADDGVKVARRSIAPSTTTSVPPSTTTSTVPPTTTAPTTTTTTPPPPPTTVPAPHVAAVRPAPPPPAPPAPRPTGAILPPRNPPADIGPQPDFLAACSGTGYDDSSGCVNSTLAALDNGRRAEGLPSMTLPSNWGALTSQEQLYVASNLERTARGLPALSAMATALDQSAATAANDGSDPAPPGGFPFAQWGATWAGGVGNPLEAIYYWMYDDGPGSSNVDCPAGGGGGCWGHRDKILMSLSCGPCVMGTGFAARGWGGQPSWAELLVGSSGNPAVDFTWQQESPYL